MNASSFTTTGPANGVVTLAGAMGLTHPAWYRDAACAENQAVEFVPVKENRWTTAAAVEVCSRCLCRDECEAFALGRRPASGGRCGGGGRRRSSQRQRRASELGHHAGMGLPQAFLGRNWPTMILASTGIGAFVAGITQSPARGGFAGLLVVLGVGCLVLSAFAPRLTEWEIGPKGVKGKLTEPDQGEESANLLSRLGSLLDEAEPLEESDLVVGARAALAGEAIWVLLQPGPDEALADSFLRLYMLDGDEGMLVPVVRASDPPPSPLEKFRPGCGATGTAFARGERVFVDGSAVSDGTHGLTPEQQEHFGDLTAVASVPIFNAAGRVLGVLTAATTAAAGSSALSGEDAYYEMLSRTLALARVLVDLLKWFDDGYDQG